MNCARHLLFVVILATTGRGAEPEVLTITYQILPPLVGHFDRALPLASPDRANGADDFVARLQVLGLHLPVGSWAIYDKKKSRVILRSVESDHQKFSREIRFAGLPGVSDTSAPIRERFPDGGSYREFPEIQHLPKLPLYSGETILEAATPIAVRIPEYFVWLEQDAGSAIRLYFNSSDILLWSEQATDLPQKHQQTTNKAEHGER